MLANRDKLWSKIMSKWEIWRLTLEEKKASSFWTKLVSLQPLKISSKVLGWMVEVLC